MNTVTSSHVSDWDGHFFSFSDLQYNSIECHIQKIQQQISIDLNNINIKVVIQCTVCLITTKIFIHLYSNVVPLRWWGRILKYDNLSSYMNTNLIVHPSQVSFLAIWYSGLIWYSVYTQPLFSLPPPNKPPVKNHWWGTGLTDRKLCSNKFKRKYSYCIPHWIPGASCSKTELVNPRLT
jgi:hypothetical protein